MSRFIDVQTVFEEIQSSLEIPSCSEHDIGFDDGLKYVLGLIKNAPTLTPQNEPQKCTGCYYLDAQCAPCAHCIRAAGYADYYRRPPEGEEDTT